MKKRLLAGFLTVTMLMSLFPLPALALEGQRPEWAVTAFDPLDKGTALQTVTQGGGEPVLPDTLTAWAYRIEDDTEVIVPTEGTEQTPPADGQEEPPAPGEDGGGADPAPGENGGEADTAPVGDSGDTLTAALVENDPAPAEKQGPDIQQITIPGVTWTAEPEYDHNTPGAYIYTPVLPAAYAVDEGVELPAITVTVEAARELEQTPVERVQALIDALPNPEGVTLDNAEDVAAQLAVIDEASEALTGEEQAALDFTRYEAVMLALAALMDDTPALLATESGIKYLDWDDSQKKLVEKTYTESATVVESDTTAWGAAGQTTWYVVNSTLEIVDQRITVNGNVHLILKDGCKLTAKSNNPGNGGTPGGINVAEGNSLTIYAQSTGDGMGQLSAKGGYAQAGIGSDANVAGGTIIINGGNVTASSGDYAAGIGGGSGQESGGVITINGGRVTANRNMPYGSFGAAIGGGNNSAGATITINGGIVTANGQIGAGADPKGTAANSFSTGTNGHAVIFSDSISDTSGQGGWKGIIFLGNVGAIYGSSIALQDDLKIPSGKTLTIPSNATLTIPDGVTLTNNGTITNNSGTLTNNGIIVNKGTISGSVGGSGNYGVWVTFDSNGGSAVTPSEIISLVNGTYQLPTNDPFKTGYTFDGWYTEQNGGTKVESSTTVTSTLEHTLYAHWLQHVPYLDENGQQKLDAAYTAVTDQTINWGTAGQTTWYVVDSTVEIADQRITVNGDVRLILKDSCKLTAKSNNPGYKGTPGGITVNDGNSLTIYAQSIGDDMGQLFAIGGNLQAGIGSDTQQSGGSITINGGSVTASGGGGSAGIGGGLQGSGGNITINGGNVRATGGSFGAGIGGGSSGGQSASVGIRGGTIIINGGSVTAAGGNYGAGIGGGLDGTGGAITINGGTVTATGGDCGAGIGGGGDNGSEGHSIGGTIIINSGEVTANGGNHAAGIGGGNSSSGGDVTINGGTVTATGGESGAGIGGGVRGAAGSFATGTNGNIFVVASSIGDQSNKGNWSGVIFEGDSGTVYGDQPLTINANIPNDKTLTIPQGKTLTVSNDTILTNNGTLQIDGTFIVDGTFTNNDTLQISGTFTVDGTFTNNGTTKIEVMLNPYNSSESLLKRFVCFSPESVGGLLTPFRSGYTFAGWYTAASGGSPIGDMTPLTLKPGQTLYAHWMENKSQVTVTFSNATPTYGDTITITATIAAANTNGLRAAAQNTVAFSLNGTTLGTANVSGSTATLSVTLTGEVWKPGSKTVTAEFGGSSAYTGSTGTGTLTVQKATPTVTAPTVKSLTYTGAAQELVNAGSTTGGTLQYSTDNSTWGTSVPTGTEAKTYTVYYKVAGGDYYNDVAAQSVTVTIGPKAITGTISITGTATMGETLTASNSVSGETVSYQWYRGDTAISGATGSTYKIVADDVGQTIKVTATGTGNYTGTATSSPTAAVGKATPTVTQWPTASAITYGQSLSDSSLTNGQASVAGTFTWTATGTKPAVSDSGTTQYDVIFTPSVAGYNTVTGGKVTLTVNKATLTPSASANGKTYDGTTSTTGTISLTGAVNSENPTASGTFAFANADAGANKTVNVTGITLDDGWGANYQLSTTNTTTTATIAQKSISGATVTLGDSLTYTGSQQTQTVTSVTIGNLTATYTVSGNQQTDVGTYTLTVTGTGNFTGTQTAQFAIAKATTNSITSLTCGNIVFGGTPSPTATATFGTATYTYSQQEGGTYGAWNTSNAKGTWYVKATVASTDNYNGAERIISFQVTAQQEATPNAGIDFRSETLTGLTADAKYSITPAGGTADTFTASASGTIDIQPGWFGKTLSIVKIARNGDYSDSAAQSLPIPARPNRPTVQGVDETFSNEGDGQITGTSTDMEYGTDGNSWTACTGTSITGLTPGTYYVRTKAATGPSPASFASDYATVTIQAGPQRTYTLEAAAPTFTAATYGYTRPAAQAITITSKGNSAASISSVTVSGSDFTIGGSGSSVTAGGSITSWTVQPNAGLGMGTHTGTITVTYNNSATATATVSFTVSAKAEDTPNISINYQDETLTGFDTGASYTINGTAVALNNGTVAAGDYMGQTISIVRTARDADYADSSAQSLSIPARPAVPTAKITVKKTDTSITITNKADFGDCEFSADRTNWQNSEVFTSLTAGQTYPVSVRTKATGTAFASASQTVNVTTVKADGSTTVKPGESVEIGTSPKTTVTNDGEKVTITTGGTTTTVTPAGEVEVGTGGGVTVPGGSTIKPGNGGPEITVGPGNGGTIGGDGGITIPGGGTAQVGTSPSTTITVPEGGGTIQPKPGGAVDVPGGSTIKTGDDGPEITVGPGNGGTVGGDGGITVPEGGTVQVGKDPATTITPPAGGEVKPKEDGTVEVPEGTTVKPGGGGSEVTVGPGNGGTVGDDGGVTVPGGGKVTIEGDPDTTITLPSGGGTVKPNPDGTIPLPGGSTVEKGGTTTDVPDNGGTYNPSTGTVTENVHTVTFDSQGGSAVNSATATHGGKVVKPGNPTKSGYTFGGWYKESGCTTAWNFDTDTVTGDITLYAKWTEDAPTHTHSYSSTWSSDANQHWHECSCGEKSAIAAHIPGEWIIDREATSATAGSRHKECTVCGYITQTEGIPATGGGPSGDSSGGGGGRYDPPTTYPVTTSAPSSHGKLTVSPVRASRNTTVTITVTPEDGYRLGVLNVTSSGKAIPLTEKGNGKYTFTMPAGTVKVEATFVPAEAPGTPWINPFVDVAEGAWYYDAVRFVSENGLMGGYGNGLFGVNDNLSRAQLAQILFNKEGRPVVNYLLQYDDVAIGTWYTEAIRWATSQGIVGGYGNGNFGPNDPITREQLAVMLWRYSGSPAATNKELHFNDADEIGGFALDALRWAVENGIINGYGDGRLGPQGLATRAQVAQMLKNFLEEKTD